MIVLPSGLEEILLKVELYPLKEVSLSKMEYAVIMARYDSKWIFVQHRERQTWEIPGGHIEAGESVFDCAARELMEESGAIKFALFPVSIYAVTRGDGDNIQKSYGMLFFADVQEMGPLSADFEMAKQKLFLELPQKLTYPGIQPQLYFRTFEFLRERGL